VPRPSKSTAEGEAKHEEKRFTAEGAEGAEKEKMQI
jgi:hypothetical protein